MEKQVEQLIKVLATDESQQRLTQSHSLKITIPLMGKGLILGTDAEGESIEHKTSLEDVKSRVTFKGKVAIENDGQGFTITPWHIYQNNLEEARLLLEKIKTEGSA